MTYPVKAISADALDLMEIESGTARKVAAQASKGNTPSEHNQHNDRSGRLEVPIA